MQCLINTSNLHVGGGIQVAASFVGEIVEAGLTRPGISIALSTEVYSNLRVATPLHDIFDEISPCDVKGLDLKNHRAWKLLNRHDRVFTVFGPLYRWRPPFTSIVGFAQPWIIYPRNEVYRMMPLLKRLRTRLKFWIQAQFFKRADVLVVELEHVRDGLVRELGIDPKRIRVVHNSLSALYADEAQWKPVSVPDADGALRLGFLGRNYVHKNTAMFPEIAAQLRARHGIEAKFYVTFTEDEWRECSPAFRAACINVGPLAVVQCPTFYRSLDAVVFPSLLECFSAAPLEAMAMEKPLFASDRPFNRDICGEHAWYFDPLSPKDAAAAIARAFKTGGPVPAALSAAREHAFAFSTPAARAQKYLALLEQNDDLSSIS